MLRPITSDRQLKNLIMPLLKEVVDYVLEEILKENKDLIEKIVYDAYDPVTYERTGEFKEAWDKESNVNTGEGKVEGEFFYDPSKLTVGYPSTIPGNPQYGQHASALDNFEMREYLADVIYQGLAGPAFGSGFKSGPWSKKRDVWKALNDKVGKAKINELILEGCKRAGLSVHKNKVGIISL